MMQVVALSGISRSAGGLFYAVSSLYKEVEARGGSISVFGADEQFSTEDQAMWHPVPARQYKAYGPLGSSPELRRLLAQSDADLIHQHGIWKDDQWAARQWQKKTGRPVVISPHGMLDPWARNNSAWKKQLVGRLFANDSLHRATCIHALCRSEAAAVRAYGLTNPIAVIPNGVDLPKKVRQANKNEQSGVKQLLFLGRIHPKKGIKELIIAWSKSDALQRGWKLLIAGWDDGEHEAALRRLSIDRGVENTVSFVGPQFGEAKEALLLSADAFILPSFSEGLPMSVLEAWSYGLPVVMTDYCNLPEGYDAGAAMRIEPNPESIAVGLERLARMPEAELQAMGGQGRKLVEQKFTWKKIAQDMSAVYEWCLSGKNPPECMVVEPSGF